MNNNKCLRWKTQTKSSIETPIEEWFFLFKSFFSATARISENIFLVFLLKIDEFNLINTSQIKEWIFLQNNFQVL